MLHQFKRASAMAGSFRRARTGTLHQRLLLQLATRPRHGQGLAQAGFTLVELMIVIVIVGILAAIAIPNFLAQTQKAKSTEAKSAISAILKQAQAQYQEDGAAPPVEIDAATDGTPGMAALFKAPADGTTKFDYTGDWDGTALIYSVTGTGNVGDIDGKTITGCVNMTSGVVAVQTTFDSPVPTTPVACTAS